MCHGEDASRVMYSCVGRGWWEATGHPRAGDLSPPHPLRDQRQRGCVSRREVPPAFRSKSRKRSPPRGCQPHLLLHMVRRLLFIVRCCVGARGRPEARRSMLGAAAPGWTEGRPPSPLASALAANAATPARRVGGGGGGGGRHGRAVTGARSHSWPVRHHALVDTPGALPMARRAVQTALSAHRGWGRGRARRRATVRACTCGWGGRDPGWGRQRRVPGAGESEGLFSQLGGASHDGAQPPTERR